MRFKEVCLAAIHALYRKDPWVQELYRTAGLQMDDIERELDRITEDKFFFSASEQAVLRYERDLAITLKPDESLEERRSAIRAKWIGFGKVDLQLLQDVANSWKNGAIALEFVGGKIHVKFISPIGVPEGLEALKKALDVVKPAHLAIFYTFMWLTWKEAKTAGTWGKHKADGEWMNVKRLKE